ncbi:UDP-N-acetylmuramate--L-alanine ligase [Janibacter sp. G1551]|uniref:UDP-N-acetylmuramate--L-alanine ligase n=1 Tax=Janibacter sp. G1551 TaxID=3420440 RepID=UPI003CFF54F0
MGVQGTNPRFDFRADVPDCADLGAVHLIAIGGAGMSAVARLLLERGVRVSGSDARDSAVLEALRAEGARVHVGHDPAHLDGVDTVVISSAIRESNVELAAARERGLRVLHRSQGLASTMAGQRRVAVAGANGKTTTSSMLTVALADAGQRPSFALGGELTTEGTNARIGEGDVFVAEADESDGSFLVYRPHVAIVTNVQPDHLDFYGDFATVEAAYAEFAGTIEPGGVLVACADDPGSARLAERAAADGVRVVTYGLTEGAKGVTARLVDLELDGYRAAATLLDADGVARRLEISVPGRHNLLNALAAHLAATVGLGVDPEASLAGLASFGGTRRRFEAKGAVGGVAVIDDYAHNPGKVEAVVRTAKEVAGEGRLTVIFQPHLYSRTRDFAAQFAAGLAPADRIVLLDIYGAREDPVDGVTSELVAEPLRASGSDVLVLDKESAVARAVEGTQSGDLVLTVGAGDVTALGALVLDALRERGTARGEGAPA